MEVVLAFTIGGLVTGAVYMLLSRNLLRLLFGVIILSNAVNLSIFLAGGLDYGVPPLIQGADKVLEGTYANPLPQALILTAIVIGFSLLAFALVLVYRGWQDMGTIDGDALRVAEPVETTPALEAAARARKHGRETA
ncbi:Na+/H+ antiporter subunit C [Aerophototrophica crusticola]|uniref:Na+/H+ antiporter subunit C n=1 Tax=Aerophototrophica crusticola TaxID=1709002 RepID=A0A858R6Z9_9PROT|nr:Na+/H+ antiporter subunit C [Rhodospirillaceae bacterium B3]